MVPQNHTAGRKLWRVRGSELAHTPIVSNGCFGGSSNVSNDCLFLNRACALVDCSAVPR